MDGVVGFLWTALIIKLATSQCPTGDQWQLEASRQQCMLCVTSAVPWRRALDYCNGRGGTLTGIHNDRQEAVVQACVRDAGDHVWIGLIRPKDGGTGDDEAWLDGKAVTYGTSIIIDDNYNTQQEDCFVMTHLNFNLNDVQCQWTFGFVCSRKPDTCLLPDQPQHAYMSTTFVTGPFGFAYSGNIITYTCATGYYSNDDLTRTCLEGNIWDKPAPTCEPVACGVLTAPANGDVVVPARLVYEAQACYSCETGYELSGPRTRTCGASGTWDLTAATCVAVTVAVNETTCSFSTSTVGLIAGGSVAGAILTGVGGALIALAVTRRAPVPPRGFPPVRLGPRRY